MRKLVSTLLLFLIFHSFIVAQTKVSYPSLITVGNGTGCFKLLPVITIAEQSDGDFSDTTAANKLYTYAIQLPPGFNFKNTAASITLDYVSISGTLPDFEFSNPRYSGSATTGRIFAFDYTLGKSSVGKGKFTISDIEITTTKVGAHGPIYRYDATKLSPAAVNGPMTGNNITDTPKQEHGYLETRITDFYLKAYEYKYTYYEYANGSSISYNSLYPSGQRLDTLDDRFSFCKTSLQFEFNTPDVSGATYTLYDNSGGKSVYNYKNGLRRLLSYYPSTTESGNKDYYIQYSVTEGTNTCTYQSDPILVYLHPNPAEFGFDNTKDTSFQQEDDPVALNDYLIPNSNPDIVLDLITGPGVNAINNQTTFLFLPGLVKSTVRPYYIVKNKNTGCQARYPFKKSLIVSDPLAPLPAYIQASRKPPFCANGSAFTVKFVSPSPADSQLVSYSLSKKSKYEYDSEYDADGVNCPDITIDPKKDNFGTNLLCYYLTFRKTVSGNPVYFYVDGCIALFPERNPKLVGLPDPKVAGDSVIELCSSSKDTIFMRPNPANGLLVLSIFDPSTNTYKSFTAANSYFELIPGETATNRFFIPQKLFESKNAADSNYNVKFKIRYSYPGTTYGQCPDTTTRIIKFAIPLEVNNSIVSPLSKPFCFGDTIKALINYDGTATYDTQDRYYWNYGDGLSAESDSLLNMSHLYKTPGKYLLRFKTIIKNLPAGYCNNDQIDTIRIGAKPKSDFEVAQNFLGSEADFKSSAFINLANPSDKKDTISTWSWDFGTSSVSSYVNDTDKSYAYTYSGIQRDPFKIVHKVTSGWGCVDSVIKYTPVFRIIEPDITTSYKDNFNDLAAANSWYASGWYKDDNLKSSWLNSSTDGANIKHTTPEHTAGASWNTMLYSIDNSSKKDNSYIVKFLPEEVSWVESPVFDLNKLTLPMVSFDKWVNTDNNFDGACLQYTICDSVAFGKEQWNVVGEYQKGVNWYNSNTVISRPQGSISLDGWSDSTAKDWSFSAYDLDNVIADLKAQNKKLVRFRMFFTSNKDNNPNRDRDGFAFDNFFVGQRNRMIVIEEFCDYQKMDREDTLIINPLVKSSFNENQAIKIQYHTSLFRNDDAINMQNPDEPSARALHYGLGKALPRGIIDGILYNNDKKLSEWGPGKFTERSLMVSPFSIGLTAIEENDSLKISADITKIDAGLAPGNYLIHLAVVEEQVSGNGGKVFTNVLRNLVPDAAGTRIDKTISWNTMNVTHSWKPFAVPNSDFKVIAFIQDEDTKEIYQGRQITVDKSIVEGISNSKSGNPKQTIVSFNEMYISPNPVTDDLRVVFNGILNENYEWTIIDAYGRVIKRGTLKAGANVSFIAAQDLPSGLYHLQMEGEGRVFTEKFAIVK